MYDVEERNYQTKFKNMDGADPKIILTILVAFAKKVCVYSMEIN